MLTCKLQTPVLDHFWQNSDNYADKRKNTIEWVNLDLAKLPS